MPKVIDDEQIYRAVMQVVTARGYAGSTTKQLAEAANISEMTLFRKYDNKLQLIKQAIAAIVVQTDFDVAIQYTGDVAADLLRVVQFYQDSAVKHGQLIFMLVAEMPRYPELAKLLEMPGEIFSNIGDLLSKYQSEGVIEDEPPLHSVSALLGPLMYTAMLRSTLSSGAPPPLDLHSHVTHYLEGRRAEKMG